MKHYVRIKEIVYPRLDQKARGKLNEIPEVPNRHKQVIFLVCYLLDNHSIFEDKHIGYVYRSLMRWLIPFLSQKDHEQIKATEKSKGRFRALKLALQYYCQEAY